MKFPAMRPQIELQRVHDILTTVLAVKPLREIVPEDLQKPLEMAADCLCWALRHDVATHPESHASNFADLMFWLEHDLAERDWGFKGSAEKYEVEDIVEED